ncbi:MAG TPA: PqqD family protein [Solirubrobacteraceae bacterium]|nr:PqqD family protein [Solirubrobacteraceae bacterium]
MRSETVPSPASLMSANVKLPQHVVFRAFPTETVVLNLQTGRYHGLNPTAGDMLEALTQSHSVREAAMTLAARYEQPRETIERDLCELCNLLLDRGLVELDGVSPS